MKGMTMLHCVGGSEAQDQDSALRDKSRANADEYERPLPRRRPSALRQIGGLQRVELRPSMIRQLAAYTVEILDVWSTFRCL
jgi:hypothetical protein